MGAPNIIPGKYPHLEGLYGLKEGARVALEEIAKVLKKQGIKPFIGSNGKQYIKTSEGKVKSLLDYAAETAEAKLASNNAAANSSNVIMNHEFNLSKNAEMIKNKFPNFKYEEANVLDPATNLQATRGSINRVRGKVSNRNAQNANQME